MKRFTILALLLIQLIIAFEMSMVMPLAPVISNEFNIAVGSISLLNLGFATSGLLSPVFGYLADKYSIKRIIRLSLCFFAAGCIIVFQFGLPGYIIGRFILGMGYFNLSTIIMSYTRMIVPRNRLGFVSGLYKISFAIAVSISPIISATLIHYISFRYIYLFLFIAVTLLIIYTHFIPNVKYKESGAITIRVVLDIFKDNKAKFMIIANFFLSLPTVFFYNYVSVHFSQQGISQSVISILYMIIGFGSILAGVSISTFSDRLGIEKTSIVATFLSGIALIPFIFLNSPVYFFGFLFGLFFDTIWGLFYPAASTFYRERSASFLTILGFVTSFTNIFTNSTAPIFYSAGGFKLLMIICSIGLLFSSLSMTLAFKHNSNEFLMRKVGEK